MTLTRVLLAVALVAAVALAAAHPRAAARPRGGVPKAWKAVSAKVDKSQLVPITVTLKRRNMAVVDKIFWEVSDPRHEKYGEHLSTAELRTIVSPGAAAIGEVLQWLSRGGVKGARVSALEDSIAFEAPIATVEKLLSVRFRMFEHQTSKQRLARALGSAKLPAAVSAIVDTVGGYRGFPLDHKAITKRTAPKKAAKVQHPLGRVGNDETMNITPAVLYSVYNVTRFPTAPAGRTNVQSFFQAQGQAVLPSDLTTFCKGFLPELADVCSITKYMGTNDVGSQGAGIESSLDSEYIFTGGHGTETWVWSYNNFDFCGDLMRWGHDVLGNASGIYPHVISMSYGSQSLPNYCLGPDVARLSQDVQLMGTVGISVMIASGDSGSGEDSRQGYNYGLLASSMPAEIPYATAVGSTTFISGNGGTEIATDDFGSGGGFSYDYPAMAYQQEAIATFFNVSTKLPPPLSYVSTGRGTPDVSALGWNFWVISGGAYEPVGGTSASTPTFSGFVSLLNNVRLQNNKTLGFLNPLLYQNPQVFNDITGGNNDVNGDGYGWYCVPGWDPATGLGTPNVGKMIDLVESINSMENHRKHKKH